MPRQIESRRLRTPAGDSPRSPRAFYAPEIHRVSVRGSFLRKLYRGAQVPGERAEDFQSCVHPEMVPNAVSSPASAQA